MDLFDAWAAREPDRPAAELQGETLTYGELRDASLHVSKALLDAGMLPGAKVPLLTQMSLEMLPAVIGILRVGACYAPMDVAMWSGERVQSALDELSSPVALTTTACPGIKLPATTVNFESSWLRESLDESYKTQELHDQLDAVRHALPADALAWTVFTSGSTGQPKGVMIYHSAVYHIAKLDHSADLEDAAVRGIRCLLAFSIAFDGCAGVVWTTLTKGGTLAMASPMKFPEVAASCNLLHLTPSTLAILDPAGPYENVRYIFLGAEAPELGVVEQWITQNRKVFTTYGPSETTCMISYGELEPGKEIPFGDLIPGVTVALVDENMEESNPGEVLISGTGLAHGYLNNPELTGKRFIQWKGKRFYKTGDLARRATNGQLYWAGRADSMVKNRGFLINLETEVEPAMLSFPGVRQAVAVMWRDHLVGCIQPASIETDKLREHMKNRFDPFVVPDKILAMNEFPLNINGKTDRLAIKARLESESQHGGMAQANGKGEATSAYDALRMGFALCLDVPFQSLDRSSSFIKFGGNSLTAIRLAKVLNGYAHPVGAVPLLKLDTIGRLEDLLRTSKSDEPVQNGDSVSDSLNGIPATDVQATMLQRSLDNPALYALIGTTTFVGDSGHAPSPSELRAACIKAFSAHSIFRTRIDLDQMTLSEMEHRELDWDEVEVAASQFEQACKAAEEEEWSALSTVGRRENEIPYFHIKCISIAGREAIAFVTRTHHALTDAFSSGIFLHGVEQALAGKDVAQGPRFLEYARFMHRYKEQKLPSAAHFFQNLVEPLPATATLQFPPPKAEHPKGAFSKVRLLSPVTVTKSALDASARIKGITSSTLVYAAWSLFLAKLSSKDHIGFSIGLSGRTIPWPSAQDVVGPLTTRAPFVMALSAQKSVQEWLTKMHQASMSVLEFDGLMHSLPASLMMDERTRSTMVMSFLDLDAQSSRWRHEAKQDHHFSLWWEVSRVDETLKTELDVHLGQVDLDWAKSIIHLPGVMIDRLVNATGSTMLGDLLA